MAERIYFKNLIYGDLSPVIMGQVYDTYLSPVIQQRESLRTLRDIGASVRQLERLTGVSRGIIQFVKK